MLQRILVLVIALGVLSLVFGLVEWRWPSVRGQKLLRRGWVTDVSWWLFTPTIGKLFSGIFVGAVIIGLARVLGMGITTDHLKGLTERDTFIASQPIALQLAEFLLLADILAYWQHRAFHHFERLWRIHAVHHSSTELDWLSAVRVHPLNDALSSTAIAAPLILLGFNSLTLAAYLPFLTFYAIGLHANVNWDLGPLRYLISSPAFHRWHHSAEAQALNKNFAGLFPVFDWLFGTLYLPRDKQASVFGVFGQNVPSNFVSQLSYPLRRTKQMPATAPAAA
jgi:sterol desaturase/sphingolipid hydroxylase (fatty acid hydroxylase superfamily)